MAAEHAHESEGDERFDYICAVRLGLPLSRCGAGTQDSAGEIPDSVFGRLPPPVHAGCRHLCANKTPDPPIDPFFRTAAGLEPYHHAGTALEHGLTRIDTWWPRLRNADKAWRDISSFYPTEPTPLAFRRELWQLPLG